MSQLLAFISLMATAWSSLGTFLPTVYHFVEIQWVVQEALSYIMLPKSHPQIPWPINPSPPSIFNT